MNNFSTILGKFMNKHSKILFSNIFEALIYALRRFGTIIILILGFSFKVWSIINNFNLKKYFLII